MSDDLVKRARHNALADMPHFASVELIEALADRIEELEAKNEHAWNMVAKGDSDVIKAVSRNRELEAKLAKAVEALSYYANSETVLLYDDAFVARTTLAELKNPKDSMKGEK